MRTLPYSRFRPAIAAAVAVTCTCVQPVGAQPTSPAAVTPRAAPPQAVPDLPAVAFEKHTLPNGLHLILHVDRKLPMVHVNQWFHVGSKNEKWAQRLPTTELQREYDATASATHDAALAAAQTYARPDRAMLLLVGDRAKIESEVRALDLGEVVVVDSVGRPVR